MHAKTHRRCFLRRGRRPLRVKLLRPRTRPAWRRRRWSLLHLLGPRTRWRRAHLHGLHFRAHSMHIEGQRARRRRLPQKGVHVLRPTANATRPRAESRALHHARLRLHGILLEGPVCLRMFQELRQVILRCRALGARQHRLERHGERPRPTPHAPPPIARRPDMSRDLYQP